MLRKTTVYNYKGKPKEKGKWQERDKGIWKRKVVNQL